MGGLRVLLVDFYDSYTFNVADLLTQMNDGVAPVVVSHDKERKDFAISTFDCVVLSPGPGNPDDLLKASSTSAARHIIRACIDDDVPLLGICLGHQLLCTYHGIPVKRVEPAHGSVSTIELVRSSKASKDDPANVESSCAKTSPDGETPPPSLFEGMDVRKTFRVVRYHSLAASRRDVVDAQRAYAEKTGTRHPLRVSCVCGDLVMGAESRERPHYGVQFHPESILSERGAFLFANFIRVAKRYRNRSRSANAEAKEAGSGDRDSSEKVSPKFRSSVSTSCRNRQEREGEEEEQQQRRRGSTIYVSKCELPRNFCAERFFERVVLDPTCRTAFWLDNAMAEQQQKRGLPLMTEFGGGAFSFMGGGRLLDFLTSTCSFRDAVHRTSPRVAEASDDDADDEGDEFSLQYFVDSKRLVRTRIVRRRRRASDGSNEDRTSATTTTTTTTTLPPHRSFLQYLDEARARRQCRGGVRLSMDGKDISPLDLPFDFQLGHVGFMSYEMKVETLGAGFRPSRQVPSSRGTRKLPDAYWFFARSCVVIDHRAREAYALTFDAPTRAELVRCALAQYGGVEESADATVGCSARNEATKNEASDASCDTERRVVDATALRPHFDRTEYEERVRRCQRALRAGESYELCFTTRFEASVRERSTQSTRSSNRLFRLYQSLRRRNAAPYSSYVEIASSKTPSAGGDKARQTTFYAVLSSSPEQFLRVDGEGRIQSKPIKGTCRRGKNCREDASLAEFLRRDPKNRAENLMIVDLVRNDLSRVCATGSVHCPKLMRVETYATVHQLVSTVAGQLDASRTCGTPGEFIKAAFPPGSMTGAPKIRSCELLEELEEVDRGVYGGCLGYVSVTNDASDLCVVIRTIVASEETRPETRELAYTFTLNSGGAITVLSTPADEYDEMLLKLRAVREALEAEFPSLLRDAPSKTRSPSPPSKGECGVAVEDVAADLAAKAPASSRTTGVFTTMRVDVDDVGDVRCEFLPLHFKRLQRASRTLLGCALPEEVASPAKLREFVTRSFADSSSRASYRVRVDIGERSDREASRAEGSGDAVARSVAPSISSWKLPDPAPPFVTLSAFSSSKSTDRIAPLPRRRVLLDPRPSETDCVECYYKTSNREVYDARLRRARKTAADGVQHAVDDVLLYNVRGEITETCIANVAIELEPGKWITPALRSGLLPGICRDYLLSEGALTERPVSIEEFRRAVAKGDCRVVGFNALRGVFGIDVVMP